MARKSHILAAILLLILAFFCCAFAMRVCFCQQETETEVITGIPEAEDTVCGFMDAICRQDYTSAYALMNGYSTLGLENTPESAEAAALWELTRGNTSWNSLENCVYSGTTAVKKIEIISPDLDALTSGLHERVNALLSEYVENAELSSDIYDESGSYRSEVVMQAYSVAFDECLATDELPMKSTTIDLKLEYNGAVWEVVPDIAMLEAFSGTV